MFIDRIILKNIRGFDEVDLRLDRGGGRYAGWTVFTGSNGSGKSSLLKAVALALAGPDAARSLMPSFAGWVRHGSDEGSIDLHYRRVEEDDPLTISGAAPSQFLARLSLENGSREPSIASGSKSKTPQRTLWAADSGGWFSCGYGPFRRLFGASPDAMRQMIAPTTERFATMFQEAASLAEVDQWLRTLNHKKLEGRQEETEQLEALLQILRDDLLPGGFQIDKVDSDGLWLRDRKQVKLAWSEMSDGYRSALALLADIVRHMIKTYGAKDVTKRSGVVLIDEIDAHLHPEWQRQIGFWLKARFPNLQFLVTTHSPIICQAADENGLFVLPEPGGSDQPRALSAGERQRVIASRPDTILLTPAFGLANTRSPEAVEKRAEYATIASKKRSGVKLTAAEKKRESELLAFAAAE